MEKKIRVVKFTVSNKNTGKRNIFTFHPTKHWNKEAVSASILRVIALGTEEKIEDLNLSVLNGHN